MNKKVKKPSLKEIYSEVQNEMLAADFRKILNHPTDKGDKLEKTWLSWFRNYLPKRYQASRATVIDSKGKMSDQIDIVLYDAYYTYMALNTSADILYIPAESVYAVFEVKPKLTKENMKYAGNKCASVRKLHRTTATISDFKGENNTKKKLFDILSGILTIDSGWNPVFGDPFKEQLTSPRSSKNQLDCGCVLSEGSFFYDSKDKKLITSGKDEALLFFFLQLLQKIQKMGNVPAIDFEEYKKALTINEVTLLSSNGTLI